MKRTLLALVLVGLTTGTTYAQGTIAFGNSPLTRVLVANLVGGTIRGNALASDNLAFAVFFGPPGVTDPRALTQVPQPDPKATIGTTPGVMINAPSVFALPGIEAGRVVSLQIRGWDAATGGQRMFGRTEIIQVTLAPASGPGAVIWQGATGTNPNRFTPLTVFNPGGIPEPSTIALAALGLGSLVLFRRKQFKR